MKFYDELVFDWSLPTGIEQGYAVPPTCKIVQCEKLNTTQIKSIGGDLNQSELNRIMAMQENIQRTALTVDRERLGPTIVFTAGVAAAKLLANCLQSQYGISSGFICGSPRIQPEDERADVIRRFKSGHISVLCNCQVVAVGFDHPPIRTLIIARPTRSRVFWTQCIGRATRPLPGTVDFLHSTPSSRRSCIASSAKPNFRIVDMQGSSEDHSLISAVDMFCSATATDQERVLAKRLAVDATMHTPEELLAAAAEQLERQRLAKELERQAALLTGKATAEFVARDVNLLVPSAAPSRSVGTYFNPINGKYAGYRMSELPDSYIRWGMRELKTRWVKDVFGKEWKRRNGKLQSV